MSENSVPVYIVRSLITNVKKVALSGLLNQDDVTDIALILLNAVSREENTN